MDAQPDLKGRCNQKGAIIMCIQRNRAHAVRRAVWSTYEHV